MQVPLLDLKQQYQTIKDEVLEVTRDIFESQYFILGPRVDQMERDLAAYCQTGYAVGVSSGTDALIISMMAADIGPGAAVLTTPYTFFATGGSVARLGARLIFTDIDPTTYNISPVRMEETIDGLSPEDRRSLKAVMPVHLYGQCADMDAILEIARRYHLLVIEDAAQAIGSEYKGRRAGSMGDFGCFSFFPSKNLGAFGDGGVVTTQSEDWHDSLKLMRMHGSRTKYHHTRVGGNFRLDALQAGVVSVKLKYLDQWTRSRQENAKRYRQLIHTYRLTDVVTPPEAVQNRHIYNQFVIRVASRRDELRQFLTEAGVGSEIYYPVPMHLQECFAHLGYSPGDFPVAEEAARKTLALPIFPELTDAQQEYVIAKIAEFYDV